MSNFSHTRVSVLVTRLTAVLAVFVALMPVGIFAAAIYFSVSTSLEANLRLQAIAMENTINTRPEYWDLNPERLHASYARYVVLDERFYVRNKQGKTVVELGPAPSWHMIIRTRPLYDFGHKVGSLEAGRSVLPEIALGGVIFLLSLFGAWLIHGPLRRVPLLALAQAEESLLQRDQYQRALLDNFPFMVWLKNNQQRYLAANTKLAQYVQQTDTSALVGKLAEELTSGPALELLVHNELHNEDLPAGQSSQYEQSLVLDGREQWYEVYQAPVFLPSGQALGSVGYAREISVAKNAEQELVTHRHHLEEMIQLRTAELSSALEAAQAANRLKTEFVSTVSHELRTPLTAINGSLGLLLGGVMGSLPPAMQKLLGMAHKNGLLLSNLINDLLDIEKLAAGKLQFNFKMYLLDELLSHTLSSCDGLIRHHQACIVVENPHPGVLVRVDGMRLQQALSNLISNAAKFSPVGAEIVLSVSLREAAVRIEVIDHGPGIPAQFRSRIFQKFAQADSSDSREKGGTGLGLAITKELIEQMHGSVGFESVEGCGSTFYLELPLAKT